MYINKSGARMQRRLSMVVEGTRIKKEKMRIDVSYETQELMNLGIVHAEAI